MPFRFSLAAVLRLRQSLEDRERLHLETLHIRRAALLREAQQTREAALQLQRSWRERLQQTSAVGAELKFFASVDSGFDQRRQQLQGALQQVEQQIAEQTRRYAEQRQKRDVLESVRESRLAEYRVQQQRREQAAIDELHLLRRHRRQA